MITAVDSRKEFIRFRGIITRVFLAVALISVGNGFQQQHHRAMTTSSPFSRRTNSESYFGERASSSNGFSRVVLQSTSSYSLTIGESELLEKVRTSIDEHEGKEDWKLCVDLLRQSAFADEVDDDLAEWYLAKAMGWVAWNRVTSAIARKYMPKPTIPNVDDLQNALEWMKSTAELPDITKAIQMSPESYLKNPAQSYQKVKSCAPREYRNDEQQLKELLRSNPSAIQNTYNCDGGGCNSECGNCWVSFANRN